MKKESLLDNNGDGIFYKITNWVIPIIGWLIIIFDDVTKWQIIGILAATHFIPITYWFILFWIAAKRDDKKQ